MSSPNCADSPRWYALHTHPKQEGRAESNLLAWKVETFFPQYRASRRNPFRSKPSYSIRPLFPGYIFVRLRGSEMFHKVRYTRGVHSIVSMGNNPVVLDDAIIAMIASRLDGKGFINLDDDIKPGDEVIVSGGAFGGLVGIFTRRMKDSERVEVLLNTVYQFSIVVPETNIKKLTV